MAMESASNEVGPVDRAARVRRSRRDVNDLSPCIFQNPSRSLVWEREKGHLGNPIESTVEHLGRDTGPPKKPRGTNLQATTGSPTRQRDAVCGNARRKL